MYIIKCMAGLNKSIVFLLLVVKQKAKVLSNVPPASGLPVQLDRILPVLLSDQYHRRALRSHLWLRPFPDQMDPYRQSMYTDCFFSQQGFDKVERVWKMLDWNVYVFKVRFYIFLIKLLNVFSFVSSSPTTSLATSTASTGSGGSSCCSVSVWQ